MRLTDAIIAATAPPKDGYKALTDGQRLFLRITPDGGRAWRLKFVVNGKESMKSLGAYPAVSITEARVLADQIREHARNGRNPAAIEREAQAKVQDAKALTFGRVGEEWLAHDDTKAERTKAKHRWLFQMLKSLHSKPIGEIKASECQTALRAIEIAGDKRETAHRAGQVMSQIFDYALVPYEDYIRANPAARRKNWLKPKKSKRGGDGHLPGITDPKQLGTLLSLVDSPAWDRDMRSPTVGNALRFLVRTFVRQEALCGAQWSEFHGLDTKTPEWRIPANRMKGPIGKRRPHIVPLSTQAAAILESQRDTSGQGVFVFPHAVRAGRGMSKGALSAALGAFGYTSAQQTPHGFRTTAATLLREAPTLRFDSELIELQLAHSKRDQVAAAYDRAQRMEERHAMMQRWADYLESLKA